MTVRLYEDVLRALASAETKAREAASAKGVATAAEAAASLAAAAPVAVRVVLLLLPSIRQNLVRGRVRVRVLRLVLLLPSGVGEHLIRLGRLRKLLGRIFVTLVGVRMVLLRGLVVGLLHLRRARIPGDAEQLVVVSLLHSYARRPEVAALTRGAWMLLLRQRSAAQDGERPAAAAAHLDGSPQHAQACSSQHRAGAGCRRRGADGGELLRGARARYLVEVARALTLVLSL